MKNIWSTCMLSNQLLIYLMVRKLLETSLLLTSVTRLTSQLHCRRVNVDECVCVCGSMRVWESVWSSLWQSWVAALSAWLAVATETATLTECARKQPIRAQSARRSNTHIHTHPLIHTLVGLYTQAHKHTYRMSCWAHMGCDCSDVHWFVAHFRSKKHNLNYSSNCPLIDRFYF